MRVTKRYLWGELSPGGPRRLPDLRVGLLT